LLLLFKMAARIPEGYSYRSALEFISKYICFDLKITEGSELPIPVLTGLNNEEIHGFVAIVCYMIRNLPAKLKTKAKNLLADKDAEKAALIEQFNSIADSIFNGTETANTKVLIGQIQSHLRSRTFIVGDRMTVSDILLFFAFYPIAQKFTEPEIKTDFADVVRWLLHINGLLGNPFEPIKVPEIKYIFSAKKDKPAQPKNQQKADNQEKQQQGEKKAKKPKAQPQQQPQAQPKEEGDPFDLIDIRVSKIVKVWPHPNADSLYREEIDIGGGVIKQVVTGVRNYVPIEEMQDRLVVVFTNIKPSKIRGEPSEAMVFAASSPDHSQVELLTPPPGTPVGTRVMCGDFVKPDSHPPVDKNGKAWKNCTDKNQLTVNADKIACYKGITNRILEIEFQK